MWQVRIEVESNHVSSTIKESGVAWTRHDNAASGLATVETKNLQKRNLRRFGKTAGLCRKDGMRLKLGVSRSRAKDPHINRSADAKFQQGDLVSTPHSISALTCSNKNLLTALVFGSGPAFVVPTDAGKCPKMGGYFSLSE